MRYKAVLFDMDGVILDSEPLHFAAFQATLGRYGHDLDTDGFEAYFIGKTDEEGFRQYFNFIGEEADVAGIMSEKSRKYLELATDQLVPYPGMVSLIKQLSTLVPLALVTGSSRIEVEIAMKACGLEDVFAVIVTSDDITHGKPDPEGYLSAAKQLQIAAHDCVVVEDSPSGVNAAIVAGIDCIAVSNTHSSDVLKGATNIVSKLAIDLF